jgi:hypothetical protein
MIMNMMDQAAPSDNTGQCNAAVNQMSKLFAGAANAKTQDPLSTELARQMHAMRPKKKHVHRTHVRVYMHNNS